jgi:hypothetical protein
MTPAEERLSKATAAGKRAAASPYEKQAKASGKYKIYVASIYVFEGAVAVWIGRHGAPWWMTWGFWAQLVISALTVAAFTPFANKLKRRKMLLAREQVHRVR